MTSCRLQPALYIFSGEKSRQSAHASSQPDPCRAAVHTYTCGPSPAPTPGPHAPGPARRDKIWTLRWHDCIGARPESPTAALMSSRKKQSARGRQEAGGVSLVVTRCAPVAWDPWQHAALPPGPWCRARVMQAPSSPNAQARHVGVLCWGPAHSCKNVQPGPRHTFPARHRPLDSSPPSPGPQPHTRSPLGHRCRVPGRSREWTGPQGAESSFRQRAAACRRWALRGPPL